MSLQEFKRAYQLAPILLVGGIAANLPNGQATILTLTEGSDDVNYPSDEEYFAHFRPLPGGTLIDFTAAQYPIFSMTMAANALLQNALKISLHMDCPARTGRHSYPSIQAIITRLKQQLQGHILAGGTFTVATPGFIYDNCLLLNLHDVSSTGDRKVQGAFQWDFYQPLITQAQAAQSYGNLMNKLANGLPVPNPPTNSGVGVSIGNAQSSQPPNKGPQ
jgi:hypothetical protein